jgi:AcrR family transcriptional regulator
MSTADRAGRAEPEAPAADGPRTRGLNPQRALDILTAATDLFGRKGFVATTTDEIAAQAGVTKRTLYRYMATKEHVLLAVHERMLDRTLAIVREQQAVGASSATEQLGRYVHAHVSALAAHTAEATVFFEQMKYLSPEARDEVVARRDGYEGDIRRILAEGVDAGEFRAVDVSLATQALMGSVNDLYRWYRRSGPLSPDDIAGLAMRLLLHGFDGFAVAGTDRVPERAADAKPAAAPSADVTAAVAAAPSDLTTFDRVLEQATTLFARRGYQGTSSAELAASADLGKGALYYHIGSKARVLGAIHEQVLAAADASLSDAVARAGTADERLREVVVEQCRHVGRHQAAVRVLLEEMRYLPEEHQREVLARRAAYEDAIRVVVGAYLGRDAVPEEQLKILVFLELGAVNFVSRWYRPDGPLTIDEIGEAFADLLVRGIAAERS